LKTISPRKTAFDILRRVDEGAYADLALDAALEIQSSMDPRDRALVTELVYGVLRQRGRLDFALSRFCRKPLAKVETRVLCLLRLGAYQLLMLDRVPARAAVHETVELARREGLERATGFINGILRSLDRDRDRLPWPDPSSSQAYMENVLSLPAWLSRRWLSELGREEAMALAESFLGPAPFSLRVNTLRLGREEFLDRIGSAGHEALPTPFAPEGVILARRGDGPLPGAAEGWYQVQDEASMLIARLLEPKGGERILDACAAPGGKTTHIAALTGNRARILALDLHPKRLELVTEGARRLGCEGIETRPWDLTLPPTFLDPGSFDRVLVDAPCSGLGVLRRNPELRWRRREADIRELAARQLAILDNVAPLLRPGGRLLYSLCTLTPEETGGVVGRFLDTHPDFAAEDLRQCMPPGWEKLFDKSGSLRTLPHRHGGMDAFFAAAFKKL
jgi:16S rRNA (cytosine967-C5)-methyltransferase